MPPIVDTPAELKTYTVVVRLDVRAESSYDADFTVTEAIEKCFGAETDVQTLSTGLKTARLMQKPV